MTLRILWASLVVLLGATIAAAQTKISETVVCPKPEHPNAIAVGDQEGHSMALNQVNCTATKPWEIQGVQNKEGVSTATDDVHGSQSHTRGYYVDTMANGDKIFYRYAGSVTLKEGAPAAAEVHWTSTGGTGKFKGVKGKGTCKGTGSGDGGLTWECEGEFQAPQ